MPSNALMGPIVISIESGLTSPGDTIAVRDRIDVDVLELGGRTIGLADGLAYDVALTNTGDGILAAGIVRGSASAPCDRCLEPAEFDIAAEVACYFLREEPEEEPDDEADFDLINLADGTIDLAQTIEGAVLMDIPYVIVCSEDCKGLCPTCGANLNAGPCGCAPRAQDDFGRANPFAALAGLTFDDIVDDEV